ncbi:MAG: hypothetical protein GY851_18175 [bacterium]|nr:hypothetical protein [bacterium]
MPKPTTHRLRDELIVFGWVVVAEALLLAIPFGSYFLDTVLGINLLNGHWFTTWFLLRLPYIPMAIIALWYAIRLTWIVMPPEE